MINNDRIIDVAIPTNYADITIFEKHPKVKERMEEYLKYCGDVTEREMTTYVVQGEKIAKKLAGTFPDTVEANLDNLRDLLWFYMAQAARYGEHYTNGAFRIDDPLKTIENYIRKCGNLSEGKIYKRISSHMPENKDVNTGKKSDHFGLDFEDQKLPARKTTLLFAPQNDGTLYFKLELHGLPPLSKDHFFKSLLACIGHVATYILTRFVPSGEMKPTRKEHISKDIKNDFKKVIKAIAPHDSIKQLTTEGCTFGKSRMLDILTSTTVKPREELTEKERIARYNLITQLELYVHERRMRLYTGEIKGNEVVLPTVGVLVEK